MKYDVNFTIDFRRNTYGGFYIALEGIDGSGKTVQMERVAEYFRDQGKDVLMVSEPRRTGLIGRVINEILQKRVVIEPGALQHLFVADRISHQEEVIIPALKRGHVVISHRCFWSAVPYGIMDRSVDGYNVSVGDILMTALSILSLYYQIVVPDKTFYLSITPEVAMSRLKNLGIPREYYETKEKLTNVKKGYDWMISKFPKEFMVIDGEQKPEDITKEIIASIKKLP